MKTMIIGYSGSGKSTLARYISAQQNTDVLHLDAVHFLPGWAERSREEELEILEDFLDTRTSWVIDGNYANLLYERRLNEADVILFMNFNRFSCLFRALKRFWKYKGTVRESMANGCPEKIDWEFFTWIVYKGRTKKYRKRYKYVQKEYSGKVITIQNQRQLNRYWESVRSASGTEENPISPC